LLASAIFQIETGDLWQHNNLVQKKIMLVGCIYMVDAPFISQNFYWCFKPFKNNWCFSCAIKFENKKRKVTVNKMKRWQSLCLVMANLG
jgi:hypothetical protein